MSSFSKPVSKLSSVIYLTLKSQIDFIFCIDVALDLPQQLYCLVDKTQSCLENIYLEGVTQSSSMKKVSLKFSQNLENTSAEVSFLIKLQAESLQLC